MFRTHPIARWMVAAVAFVLGTAFLIPIIQANVQKWAESKGYDLFLVKYAGPVVDKLAEITQSTTFIFITGFFIGGAVWLWVDYALRRRTRSVGIGLAIAGLVLLVLGAGIFLFPSSLTTDAAPKLTDTPTNLRLQFGEPGALPVATHMHNVWRWYALANVFVGLFPDGTKKETRVWSVFVTFEKPIDVKQVIVKTEGANPRYEVKDRDSRSLVIAFDDMSHALIDIVASTTGTVSPPPQAKPETRVESHVPPKRAKPFYDETDLKLMLSALREVREVVDKKIAPASWTLNDISQSWTHMLTKDGPAAVAQKLEEIHVPIKDAYNGLNQWLYNNQHYDSELRPVISGYDAVSAEEGTLRDLISELKEYANAQNVNLAKILQPRYEQWANIHPKVGEWIGKTDARIRDKTKELREWKNED